MQRQHWCLLEFIGHVSCRILARGLTIIFSTIARVSPSRSLSFEFSGVIFVVSILGADVTTCGHQDCWLTFSRWIEISFESSSKRERKRRRAKVSPGSPSRDTLGVRDS